MLLWLSFAAREGDQGSGFLQLLKPFEEKILEVFKSFMEEVVGFVDGFF